MPANLPPQYLEAERRFREAPTVEGKIRALEEMLAVMPKHKGTDKLKALLRRRMAGLQDDLQKSGGSRKGHDPYHISREGAGQVALYGLPNTGKSALLSALTHAVSAVADYPFTTREPVPGMMSWENIQIQLVDLPPLMDEVVDWLPRVLRAADALALVLDAGEDVPAQLDLLLEGLREMGLPALPGMGAVAGERRLRAVLCLNKSDLPGAREAGIFLERFPLPRAAVSTLTGTGFDDFRRAAYRALDIIRVYTKAPHERPDLRNPIILPAGSTVEPVAASLHKDFLRHLRFARIWGDGFHDGQMVARDQVLPDGAVVELHV